MRLKAARAGQGRGDFIAFVEDQLEIAIGSVIVRPKPTSFRLIQYLVSLERRWAPPDDLRKHVLGTHVAPGASNVRWHVLQSRAALGLLSPFLHSDPRLGFRFDLEPCQRPHCAASATRGGAPLIHEARRHCGLTWSS